jgi:hypothetical protein
MIQIFRQEDSSIVISQSSIDQYNAIQDASIMRLYSTETVSRTIYVDASLGNDLTGDGSVAGLPYATIGKALSTVGRDIWNGVTTTISIGVGNFTMNASDIDTLGKISGTGILNLQGTLVLCASGFTMGSAQALDPLTYAVSGGDTSTWTVNQWKFYFLKSGTSYYPITADTSTTLSLAFPTTGTEIYQAQTIINLPAVSTIKYNTNFTWQSLKMIYSSGLNHLCDQELKLFNCNFEGNFIVTFGDIGNVCRWFWTGCTSNITRQQFSSIGRTILNSYFYNNGNSYCLGMNLQSAQGIGFGTNVFENANTGALSCGLLWASGKLIAGTQNAIFKFQNCYAGIATGASFLDFQNYNSTNSYIISNTNYFIRKSVTTSSDFLPLQFKVGTIYGTPITRWFYDTMYEFVNLTTGRNIQITGFLYPEFEQNLSYKLINNAATDISIGSVIQNKSLHVDYTLQRANDYSEGSFNILIDNSANLTGSVDRYISFGTTTDASAIRFDAILDASILKFRTTLDATGGDASIYYNISRVMRTPLTI